LLQSCLDEKIVEICFSTRPDAVTGGQLSLSKRFRAHHLPVSFELGFRRPIIKRCENQPGAYAGEFIDAALAVNATVLPRRILF
jgi:radical SAM superfamily enzyme